MSPVYRYDRDTELELRVASAPLSVFLCATVVSQVSRQDRKDAQGKAERGPSVKRQRFVFFYTSDDHSDCASSASRRQSTRLHSTHISPPNENSWSEDKVNLSHVLHDYTR